MGAQAANGGLGEYYSEADTRVPTWLLTGDTTAVAGLCGLDAAAQAGGVVDTDVAATWLNDGIAPNGQRGRAFGEKSVHGFDLTFAAPKSVSLLRVLTDPVGGEGVRRRPRARHRRSHGLPASARRVHAGAQPGHRDEGPATSPRAGGRSPISTKPRAAGIRTCTPTSSSRTASPAPTASWCRSIRKSLYHEAKAAGMIYQATLRHQLHVERGFEWQPVDEHSGMAEIAGVTKDDITAWSRRSTRLREWATQNLVVVDGEPTAAQLAAAQKATRPTKPESLSFEQLKADWRADARGLHLDRAAHAAARTERGAPRARTRCLGPRRASPRRRRASTRPGSPAPTWSN